MQGESKVKSLTKAMRVLECFSVNKPELGVTEIAQMTGLPKSTVHNILSTFTDMGYVCLNEANGRYFLGLRLLHFGYIVNTHLGLRSAFLPYLQKIVSQTGETTYLGIPHGSDVLYIESTSANGPGAMRNILGERAPMYCTGLGKAMLAWLPDSEARFGPLNVRFTERTITDRGQLAAELERVRARGYSIDNMEHEHGVKCVAVPIFSHAHELIAAVSVSAPSLRMGNETIERYAELMKEILQPLQNTL